MPESFQVTLEKVRQRDALTIAELIATHHHSLRGYVAAISRRVDSIDDLSQEVFLRALQRLDRIETLEDFPRFLRGIARNVCREQTRQYVRSEAYVEFVDGLFSSAEKKRFGDAIQRPQPSRRSASLHSKIAAKIAADNNASLQGRTTRG